MSSTVPTEHGGAERRDCHRIGDRVRLGINSLAADQLADAARRFEAHVPAWSELRVEFDRCRREQEVLLEAIGATHPALETFLGNVERRLDVLARAILAQSGGDGMGAEMQADLSASGMRFPAPGRLATGQALELHIALPLEGIALFALGEVVRCTPCDETGWQVAVRFTHIKPADREALMGYVVRRDVERLRLRRQQQDEFDEL